MNVLLVDWLGRGGIAQTTGAWATELERAGHHTTIVTRPGRELETVVPRVPGGRWRAHLGLIRAATDVTREQRPDVVVIQNYVIPPLEGAVLRAASEVGSRVVVVVHNDRPHAKTSGTQVGLTSWLRRADDVVAHSNYVASRLPRELPILVMPLPPQFTVLDAAGGSSVIPDGDDLVALQFGVLKRGYKNTSLGLDLAQSGVPGWRFVFAGAGAPGAAPGFVSVDRYLDAADLRATVTGAPVTLLPYRSATQSATVSLSQALGSVPLATAVGGIPEQIDDGVTGMLVPPAAPPSHWRAALETLSDAPTRRNMQAAARKASADSHARFVAGLRSLVGAAEASTA